MFKYRDQPLLYSHRGSGFNSHPDMKIQRLSGEFHGVDTKNKANPLVPHNTDTLLAIPLNPISEPTLVLQLYIHHRIKPSNPLN
jgi:hypothetical protein